MSWKNVKLIFQREVRDQLRDRRTLIMIFVVPLLLYPALGIGMFNMAVTFTEQPRTVVVLGAEHLPQGESVKLLDKHGRFVRSYFRMQTDAEKLRVVTDDDSRTTVGVSAEKRRELLTAAKAVQEAVLERTRHAKTLGIENAAASPEMASFNLRIGKMLQDARIQVLIVVPPDFGANIEQVNRQLAEGTIGREQALEYPGPIVVRNRADEKSQIAYRRVKEALDGWASAILKERLKEANLPEHVSKPVNSNVVDVAEKGQLSANLWSKLFPALLVIMAVTGAFYPAVDLAAGEKERGTMETLLICPASRTEIVLGKFLTVCLFSVSTVILNLTSMGLTGKYMVSLAGDSTLSKLGSLEPPSLESLVWVLILLLPMASLFSALCLALATFARSSKEGQYYLTPLLMATMGMTLFCLSPLVEMQPMYSVLPVVGPTLLLKELLGSSGDESLVYALPVLVSSIVYSLLALWWAIEQFAREDVLFREAERFELGLWLKQLFREKEPTPSFIEAGLCVVLIVLLMFGSLKVFASRASANMAALEMLKMQMIYLLAAIACPALIMGVMLTTSFRKTFRLNWPGWKMLAVGVVLPLALFPLTTVLLSQMSWFFPELPVGVKRMMQAIGSEHVSLGFALLAFAVTPAICEEVAFRGFVLSGFQRSKRLWLAIVLSSLTFGFVHMIPQQVFNAALLGLALGLLAVRSNSLLPPVLFHFVFNGIQVVLGRLDEESSASAEWLFDWPFLLLAAAIAGALLYWLIRHDGESVELGEGGAVTGDAGFSQVGA